MRAVLSNTGGIVLYWECVKAVLSNTGGIVFRTYWKCVRAVLSNGIVIMFLQCTIEELQTSRTSAYIEQRNVQPPREDAEGKGVEGDGRGRGGEGQCRRGAPPPHQCSLF